MKGIREVLVGVVLLLLSIGGIWYLWEDVLPSGCYPSGDPLLRRIVLDDRHQYHADEEPGDRELGCGERRGKE